MFITKDYHSLAFENHDGIGLLIINRADKYNALNSEVLGELKDFLQHIINEDKNFSLKGLILTGAGERAFIAGADIAEMSGMNEQRAREFGLLGQEVSLLFEQLPIPVIAAVNGFALGGGLEMAMSCDFVYATENAQLGQPEVKLGLIPGFGGTQRLSRLIGRQRAKEFIFSGRSMRASEASEIGLVTRLFATKDEMLSTAFATLRVVAKNSPLAIKMSKRVMNLGNDLDLTSALRLELDEFSGLFNSQDMKEGTMAFMEKRSPIFKGL